MPLETACPHCGTRYRDVPDTLAGKSVRCRGCGETFAVVAQEPRTEPPAPPAAEPTKDVDVTAAPAAEQATITIICPSCGTTSPDAPARLAGKRVRCPKCNERFVAGADAASVEIKAEPAPVEAPPVTAPAEAAPVTAPEEPQVQEPVPAEHEPAWPPDDLAVEPAAAAAEPEPEFHFTEPPGAEVPDMAEPVAPPQPGHPLPPEQPIEAPPPTLETQPSYEPPPEPADSWPETTAEPPQGGVEPAPPAAVAEPPAEPFPDHDPFADEPLDSAVDPAQQWPEPPPGPAVEPPPAEDATAPGLAAQPPAFEAPPAEQAVAPGPAAEPSIPEAVEAPLSAPEAVDLDIGSTGEAPDPLAAEVEAFSTRPIPIPKDLAESPSPKQPKRRRPKAPATKPPAILQPALATALKFLLGPNVAMGICVVWAPLTAVGLDGVIRIAAAAILGVIAGVFVTAMQTLALLAVFKGGGLRIVGLVLLVPSVIGWLAAGVMGLVASPQAEIAATATPSGPLRPTAAAPLVGPSQQPEAVEPEVEPAPPEVVSPTAVPDSRDADALTLALNGVREALRSGQLEEADRLLRGASLLAPSDPAVVQAARDLIRQFLIDSENQVRRGTPHNAVSNLERARAIALRFGFGPDPIDAELARIQELAAAPLIKPSERAAIARLAGKMVEVKLKDGETRKGRLLRISGDQLEVEAMGEVGPGRMSFNLAIPLDTVEGVRPVNGG